MADRGRTLTLKLVADVDQATRGIQTISGQLAGFASWGARIAGVFGVAFSVDRIVDFATEVTNLATQTELATRNVGRIFGEYAGQINQFAETSAEMFGVSRREALEAATLLGTQLQNYGVDLQTAAGYTSDLIARAGEMAATFGGPTSQAVNAIGGLLRGEYDTIERYGVAIKQSDVNARLAALGLGDLEGAALKNATAQAVLGLFFEQTAGLAGTLTTNADTLAVKQQILTARWEDARAKLGEELLPLFERLTDWLLEDGLPLFERFTKWVREDLRPELEKWADKLADVWAWFERNHESIKKVLDLLTLPQRGLVAQIRVLVELFGAFNSKLDENVEHWKDIADAIKSAWEWLGKFVERAKSMTGVGGGSPFLSIPGLGTFPNPFNFGAGGVVPGPIGAPVAAIVHGGERVIPAGLAAAGVGAAAVVVNVYPAPLTSPAETGAAVVDAIREYERNYGAGWRTGSMAG
jgi:hypothetical protein